MTVKKIYFLLICLITLIGCSNSQTEKTEKNFVNYFFQPDWFEQPKIYEFEFNSTTNENSKKYFAYRYFERIDDKQLKCIIYDQDFNQIVIIVYEYLTDKVIIKEATTVETWNDNKHTKEKLTDNVVFDYHKMKVDFGFTHTSRMKDYPDVTKYVTRNIKKTDKRNFESKDVNVLIADGQTKIIVKTDSEDYEIINNEKLIYAENIGVIYQEVKNRSVETKAQLTRILSKEEFYKMKNARYSVYKAYRPLF